MTHPTKPQAPPTRARSVRTAAAVGVVVLAAGASAIAFTSTSAQAATQTFHLYSQISTAYQPTPVDEGNQDVALTVSPASAAPGASIEVVVTSSTLTINNGPAATAAANGEELDAVVAINGTDYTLRGSQNAQAVAANNGNYERTPVLFKSGWSISSTPGNSSSFSDDGGADTATPGPEVGTGANVAGTGGLGTAIRGAEATIVPLTAPATPGTYPLTLKALVLNTLSGTSTVALTDTFDDVYNTAVATVTSPGPTNNGPKNTFNNNVATSYLTYSPTVDLTVATSGPTDSASVPPTDTTTPTPTDTSSVPPVDTPSGAIGGVGVAVLAAVAGLGVYAWSRRPRRAHDHE